MSASQAGQPRLECRGITVRYGGLLAVKDIDLDVQVGEIAGLVGPNGAGKSTLFGVISGLQRPSGGRVRLDGEDVTDIPAHRRAAKGLARTFQHPELFSGLTVRDHLVIAYRAKHARTRVWSDLLAMGGLRRSQPDEQEVVDGLIDLLGIGGFADVAASGLPLGLARLVELGRALASAPTVLLLDEPSSGLDSSETAEFETALRRVAAERNLSVLLVEHDVELVLRLCSTVNVLDFGVLIASGSPADVRGNPVVRAAYLGEEVEASRRTDPAGSTSAQVSGATDPAAETSLEVDSRIPALAVHDLSVRYGDALALQDVSFDVTAGQVVAVLGANGSGKSSLARAVSGLIPSCGGRIEFDGVDISSWSPHRIRKAGLVHLPESRGVFPDLTVIENLRMAASGLSGRQARQEGMSRVLDIFPALASRRKQKAVLLSGGEQQMLSLARSMVASPKLLIADEMSLGLAPKMVDVVFEGLGRARAEGVTIVMIEQYVHRALALADDCLILHRGRVVWRGAAADASGGVLEHYMGGSMAAAS